MNFRLFYRGHLRSNGNPRHKHQLREAFHVQLQQLWQHPPLAEPELNYFFLVGERGSDDSNTEGPPQVGGFTFQLLARAAEFMYVELDITMLCPEEPGRLIQGGDIDNRMKTLFDALRYPKESQEIPPNATPNATQTPFYCLLEDDRLIRKVSVTYDRLLDSVDPREVVLLINVRLGADIVTPGNFGLIG